MTFILSEGARLLIMEGGAWQSASPAPLRGLDSAGKMIPISPIRNRSDNPCWPGRIKVVNG